jgi:hypothetical protein
MTLKKCSPLVRMNDSKLYSWIGLLRNPVSTGVSLQRDLRSGITVTVNVHV